MFLDYLHTSFTYLIFPALGFFVLIFLSLVSLLRGRKNPTNTLFAAICLIGALVNADMVLVVIIPDEGQALVVEKVLHFFFVFTLPLYIQFIHTFLGIAGRTWLVYIAALLSLVLAYLVPSDLFISGFHYYDFGRIARGGPAYDIFAVLSGVMVLYSLVILFMAMRKASDNQQKTRIKYILWGMGLSAVLIASNILTICGLRVHPMGSFSVIPAVVLAYGVLKYDLLDMGALIRRGTIYFILTGILGALYILIIYLFNAFFMMSGYDEYLLLPLVLAAMIVLLFNPLSRKVQRSIDKVFFRGRYDYQKLLKEISGEMASLLKFNEVKHLLFTSISHALHVTPICLIVYDGNEGHFRVYSDDAEFQKNTVMSVFDQGHPLIALLEKHGRPLSKYIVEKMTSPEDESDRIFSVFDTLRASMVVPMISHTRLIGMIALGQKKSGELFVHEDLELLTTIANQSVIALENAKSYEEIEKLNRDLEKKVEERTAALRQALEEKERTQQQLIQSESLAAIGQLVAGTAHELNNPLASASSLIQTSTEAVGEWEVKNGNRDEVISDLEFSLKELKRAGDIVRSLLDLSRQTQVYVEPVDINVAIDDALRVLNNHYKHLPMEIEKKYDEELPLVEGNFANLGQVFINVIKNAIEALTDGKGKITLVTAYNKGMGKVVIECRDTGKGISDNQLQNIFKPFYTTKEVGKGTGLGLYISHEIVKRHGGLIHVESEEGKGSVFSIELPYKHKER
jgi:two-component system NtrC family sensor kinase